MKWKKSYGPDDLSVNSVTGEVTWDIPSDLASESFHVGVMVIDHDGNKHEDTWVLTVGSGDIVYVGSGENHEHV